MAQYTMRSEVLVARKAVQRETWLWIALLATGMIVGAVLVGLVALTSVVLPYDQEFVRLTSRQLAAMNPRLLPFMVHDRVTLAGIMLSIGILYGQLALHALRKGEYWAMLPVAVSGAVGFASFFLFLGFGYFDPLHATVSAILFVYFLLGLRAWLRETGWRRTFFPSAKRWRDVACPHLMEKALLLLTAVGIIVGGLTIAFLGVTTVFVPEDIAFLQATPATLHAMNERLIPLIARSCGVWRRAGIGRPGYSAGNVGGISTGSTLAVVDAARGRGERVCASDWHSPDRGVHNFLAPGPRRGRRIVLRRWAGLYLSRTVQGTTLGRDPISVSKNEFNQVKS